MSLYVPEIRSQKPEVRSGHICFVFRGHVFIWGGFNVSDYKFNNIPFTNIYSFLYFICYCF